MVDFLASWPDKVTLMEFTYNNSYQQSLKKSPYQELYGRKYQSPIHWHEASERKFLGPGEVDKVSDEIEIIKNRLQASVDQ